MIICLFCLSPSNGVWVAAGWGWLVRFLAAGCGLNKAVAAGWGWLVRFLAVGCGLNKTVAAPGLGVAGTLPRRWLRVKQDA